MYAAAWSAPTARVVATTSACVPPTFAASSYSFSVNGDAAAGAMVGSVSATGSGTDDPVTYAIASGGDAGLFAIGETTGVLTVAGDLSTAVTLTVEARGAARGAAAVTVGVAVTATPEYLTEETPPCTPAPGSTIGPCDADVAGIAAAPAIEDLGTEPWSVRFYIDGGSGRIHVAHLVLRGVYLPGTVRCTAGGHRFRPPPYTNTDSQSHIRGTRAVNCYADVRVNAYVLGSGPSTLTVLVRKELYWFSEDEDLVERLRLDIERVLAEGGHHARVSVPSGGITGREVMLFIGPSVDMSIEAWRVFTAWDVKRRDDDTVVAVHPHRDAWRVVSPDEFQAYRSVLEMELPAFTQAVTTANQVRVAEYGGRTGPDPSFPMLVTDANQLRQFFTAVGAYNHPDGPPAQPPPVSACATGTTATDTGTNPRSRLRIAVSKEGRAAEQDHAGLGEDVVQAGAEVDLRHGVSRRSIPHTVYSARVRWAYRPSSER